MLTHTGGVVCARAVKLLDKIDNPGVCLSVCLSVYVCVCAYIHECVGVSMMYMYLQLSILHLWNICEELNLML